MNNTPSPLNLNGTWRHYGNADGVSDQFTSFLFADREGRIWFGGSQTLGYYDGKDLCDLGPAYRQQHGEDPIGPWPAHCSGIAQDGAACYFR